MLKINHIKVSKESGFTLLEVVVVVGLIALIATSLASLIISQFEMFDFNTRQGELNNQSELIFNHLEQDTRKAIHFAISDNKLSLDLDVDSDGDIDKIVEYDWNQEKSTFIRKLYLGDAATSYSTEIINDKVSNLEFKVSNEKLLRVDILLDGSRKLVKEFYISESEIKYLESKSYGLNLDGKDDYVAIDKLTYQDNDYSELTLITKIKTTDDNGVIYSFDGDEYFELAIANGKLNFIYSRRRDISFITSIVTRSIISNQTINDGQEHIVAIIFNNGLVQVFIDKQRDKVYLDDFLDGFLGWLDDILDGWIEERLYDILKLDFSLGSGDLRYGFIGAGSEADTFNGAKDNNHFEGEVYWLQHWSKVLTEQQIRLYSNGVLTGKEEGLQLYYPINIQDILLYDSAKEHNGRIYGGNFKSY